MPGDATTWWELLRALDDPDHLEFPRGYDHGEARARFDLLAESLDAAFGCRCSVDRWVQDASHHGDITVPADRPGGGPRISVRVSNFGGLAVYSPENVGCHSDADKLGALSAEDRRRVEGALSDLGYVTVPEDLLHERYDGRADLTLARPGTWFVRFFDYI
ncbi:hypothetical protein F0L68_10135 [Solihabitans fulvus]|uniref:Uncharacterized protein n=1 Tax=Solihabitans fulvus TaxID=1892852 RepID=A0A5B2XKU1_9PSEU|nr:hypothetical protein [Solihabitans fulvus]KAA2263382.1 hypothetical protein F0L68_10135 [Solihabitans fulvus]